MKTLLISLLLVVGFIGVSGCAPTTSNKDKIALDILQRLDEFQDLTIDLYDTKEIDSSRAALYTKFILSSTKVIRSLPLGWESTVKSGWVELKGKVPFDKMEVRVQIIAAVLDKLIGAL